jgi:octaprenyl-diphosphate synthase
MRTIIFKVIDCKTAKLFESCGSLAGVLNNVNEERIDSLAELGRSFGIIFQLTDDILDYSGKEIEIGKNIGDDLADGKVTLPLIYAMKKTSSKENKLIKDAIKMGDINHLPEIIQILYQTNAINDVRENLDEQINKIDLILNKFEDNETSHDLRQLAALIAKRKS